MASVAWLSLFSCAGDSVLFGSFAFAIKIKIKIVKLRIRFAQHRYFIPIKSSFVLGIIIITYYIFSFEKFNFFNLIINFILREGFALQRPRWVIIWHFIVSIYTKNPAPKSGVVMRTTIYWGRFCCTFLSKLGTSINLLYYLRESVSGFCLVYRLRIGTAEKPILHASGSVTCACDVY